MNKMTSEELVLALKTGSGDGMWVDRTIALLETLSQTEIDPYSPSLLDDMHAARFDHPKIGAWLFELPGHRAGNFEVAERQLGYLKMQIKAVAKKGA